MISICVFARLPAWRNGSQHAARPLVCEPTRLLVRRTRAVRQARPREDGDWSLGREGSGFWWEDELQTFLVPLGASTNEASELSRHFGLTHTSELPAVAWVRKEAALGFELHRPQSAPSLVEWVYMRLASSLKVRCMCRASAAQRTARHSISARASEPRVPPLRSRCR